MAAAAQTIRADSAAIPASFRLTTQCVASDSEGGEGGDATSRSGRGGNGGLALLHETITGTNISTVADSQRLQTGSIHNEVSFLIEDTDETVVISLQGNPGSRVSTR